jgi:uncharacterized protein
MARTACKPTYTKDSPLRSVGVFVVLTTCLSGIFWALINLTHAVNAMYDFALMWMPALAAVLTCRRVGRPLISLGLGRWNTEFVTATADGLGLNDAGVGAAAGEEIGWRGFLVPELGRVLPFTGVALVSGLIWAAWHYPSTSIVYRDVGLPAWFWLLTFTFVAIAISLRWHGCGCARTAIGRQSSCTPATTCGCSRSSSR